MPHRHPVPTDSPHRRRASSPLLAALALALVAIPAGAFFDTPPSIDNRHFDYPNVPVAHRHMRLLLDNAFQYVNPDHGIVDPVSGYPAEGWNQEPQQGLFLRSFTQLTAIGVWVELLANIVAGYADNPYLSQDSALRGLERALATLLEDQRNPALAANGLLVNFLGLEAGQRTGPLLESIERAQLIAAFGERQGAAIWAALVEKGWIKEEDQGRRGRIVRDAKYGARHFDGVLAPYAAEPTRSKLMALLDRRPRTIVFGDNANLTAALARSAGALLKPEIRNHPKAIALRAQIERFIEGQKAGYAHLFDPATGTFVFGWDATADRFMGWDDGRGHWVTGQMNYFINEFRGPWTFVVLRYGLPVAAIRNAGFKIKPYRDRNGRETYALAAWDGSAFQLLGLSLFMQELDNPGWKQSLDTLVDSELDFSSRNALPGLLSEAYSGRGTEYTGLIGIPDLAVADTPLTTTAPSLYTLGVAYAIAPEKVERFLQDHWPTIARLLTDHGPWEGWNTATQRAIPYQTTAHTLSLILGALDSAQDNMRRYLDDKRLLAALAALYAPGERIDFLAAADRVLPWTSDGSALEFSREAKTCRFSSQIAGTGGMAFVLPQGRTVNLSNGTLILRFRSETELQNVVISFKRAKDDPLPPPTIPIEILARFAPTPDGALAVVLPATPALSAIHEVALDFRSRGAPIPVDVAIRAFEFVPFDSALAKPDNPVAQ